MNRDIIHKLNTHVLDGHLRSEPGVTYLLVQLFKLLERQGLQRKYPYLTFFRHWAVHSQLHNTDILVQTLAKILSAEATPVLDPSATPARLAEAMRHALRALHNELYRAFTNLTDAGSETRFHRALLLDAGRTWWPSVTASLLFILSDIPLQSTDGTIQQLRVLNPSPERAELMISLNNTTLTVPFAVPLLLETPDAVRSTSAAGPHPTDPSRVE